MSFRDSLLQYNQSPVFWKGLRFSCSCKVCSICVYFKEKRKNGELLLLTLQRLFKKVVSEPNRSSKDIIKRYVNLLILKHNRLVLIYYLN